MRRFLLAALCAALPVCAQAGELVLLGTAGGPMPRTDRAGIATLLRADGHTYLVDAGDGVNRQLAQAGVAPPDVPLVFLTHLHDDHYAGLPGLATFAYTLRGKGMELIGPPGTSALAQGIAAAMQPSADIRIAENHLPLTPAQFIHAREVQPGAVFDDGTVKVTAVANTHYSGASALSYAYRFAVDGKVIVFTGDTGPSPAVEQLAKGADILIAEMASAADREHVPPMIRPHMDKEHLSPIEVGRLAQKAGVGMLVLSHVGDVAPADLAAIRTEYKGKLMLGADMMRIAF